MLTDNMKRIIELQVQGLLGVSSQVRTFIEHEAVAGPDGVVRHDYYTIKFAVPKENLKQGAD